MKRKASSFATLLATLLIAGSGYGQTAPSTQPPAGAPPSTGRAPDTESGLPAMPEVKDPMLEPVPPAPNVLMSWKDALRQIRARSTELHIARAQVNQTAGVETSAFAQAMPKLSATGNASHVFIQPNPNPYNLPADQFVGTLDLRVPLLNLPFWNSVGKTKADERAAQLNEKDVQRQRLAAVAQDAVAVITNERIVESNRVSLASALSTADLTRRRAVLGAANAVDVLRAEGDVSTARALVVSGDETLRQARETLGLDLGYTGQWGVAPDIKVEELERTAAQYCRAVPTIESRADVRSAATSLEAAERDRTTTDYTYAPTVDASTQLGYFSYEFRSPSFKHLSWVAGATATWLLFDGGDRAGQRRQKEAARTIAQETLTQTRRAAALQALQADRSVLVAIATLEVAAKARDIAKERARLSRVAFINGSGTSFDLVDSAKQLREAEIDLLNKEFGVYQAKIAAFLAKADCSI